MKAVKHTMHFILCAALLLTYAPGGYTVADYETDNEASYHTVLYPQINDTYEALKQEMRVQMLEYCAGDRERLSVETTADSADEAKKLFRTAHDNLIRDYPEDYFCLRPGFSINTTEQGNKKWSAEISLPFTYPEILLNKAAFQYAVDQACLECFGAKDGKNSRMTDFEKIIAAYDWVAANCRYDPALMFGDYDNGIDYWTAPTGTVHTVSKTVHISTPYAAFVARNGDCGSYTSAFKVLMDRAGIDCCVAVRDGHGTAGNHVWNLVKLNGVWYHIDCTWASLPSKQSGVYDYAGQIQRSKILRSDADAFKTEREWKTEYEHTCPETYRLPEALTEEVCPPSIYHDGHFYLTDSSGTIYRYTAGTDFQERTAVASLGFKPGAGVCDHATGTLYYTKEGFPLSIWSYTPGKDAAPKKFADISELSRGGLYCDNLPDGSAVLRVVYCYENIQEWTLHKQDSLSAFTGRGTEESPWMIKNAEELRNFAALVNAGHPDYISSCFALSNDIDLTGKPWTPVGKNEDNALRAFQGKFDGRGHTIRGISIESENYAGFFAALNGADIRNIKIAGSVHGGSYTGGLVGFSFNTAITGCVNNCDITGKFRVGGIAGYLDQGDDGLSDCSNSGNIVCDGRYAGGITGFQHMGILKKCTNSGEVSGNGTHTGGIVGHLDSGSILDCSNDGLVSGNDQLKGGIAGSIEYGELSGCTNTADISGLGQLGYNVGGIVGFSNKGLIRTSFSSGKINAAQNCAGGILGRGINSTVEKCFSTCDVNANDLAGGIAGRLLGSDDSKTHSVISDCYNIGNVRVRASEGAAGGIVGDILNECAVKYSYNAGTVSISVSSDCLGGVVGIISNSAEIQSCYFLKTSVINSKLAVAGTVKENGRVDEDSCGMDGDKFGEWSRFHNWNAMCWAIQSGLNSALSSVTTRPILVELDERTLSNNSTTTSVAGEITTEPHVLLSLQNLDVNGKSVKCEAYNIDGSNYFKLRDVAKLLDGTSSQFQVEWDANTSTIKVTTGAPYTADGNELILGEDHSGSAVISSQSIIIDETKVSDLSVYNIAGRNFFKIRDLGSYLNFDVGFDGNTNTVMIHSR